MKAGDWAMPEQHAAVAALPGRQKMGRQDRADLFETAVVLAGQK